MTSALSSAREGIQSGTRRMNQAAERISRQGADDDVASNIVELKAAQRAVQVNLVSAKAADKTIGTILDILA